MIGDETDNNLMDELINLEQGTQSGKRYINRKQLVEIVGAMRRDGDEVEEILESLRDYIVDFKNTVDRPMVLPIIQDVDDGRYGAPRKWMNQPVESRENRAPPNMGSNMGSNMGGFNPSPAMHEMQSLSGAAPMMASSMGITDQIREMYNKYVTAFQSGDLDNAMFYKNAFQELLEMRNQMYPTMGGQGSQKSEQDDWAKQLMVAMVTQLMGNTNQKTPETDVMSELDKMTKMKDLFGWGAPRSGGLSENAAIAAMQVAAPEIGKLTDTVGQLVQHRQQGNQAADHQDTYQEMQDKERDIRANYTACPQCQAVIPKWTKQCHKCGVIFNDQFAGAPSEYGGQLPQRKAAGRKPPEIPSDPGLSGMIPSQGSIPMPSQQMMMEQMMQNMYNDYEDEDMTEQEIWFDQFYPRLVEWISQGAEPRKKIQAVWALADTHEQRQLVYLAQYRDVEGLLKGMQLFANEHPEHAGALDFLSQPGSMTFMSMLFKEVKLLANEDNIVLAKQDIHSFEQLWPSGQNIASNPAMPGQQPAMPMQQLNQQPSMAPVEDYSQIAPDQVEMLQQMEQFETAQPTGPHINLQPPQHLRAQGASSLKDKLRRKQLGLE